MTLGDPIAFLDHQSFDPITGELGILRDEWRISPVSSHSPESISSALGPHWRLYFVDHALSAPTIILEHRYIRRGDIEPWTIVSAHSSDDSALWDIDPKAISLDCPRLLWIQHERKQLEIARREEEEQSRLEANRLLAERQIRADSDLAFVRLAQSKWSHVALAWNDFTSSPDTLAILPDLKLDREFVRLHNLVMNTTTVPAKRSAIRACLDYYDFMWRHREPKQ